MGKEVFRIQALRKTARGKGALRGKRKVVLSYGYFLMDKIPDHFRCYQDAALPVGFHVLSDC